MTVACDVCYGPPPAWEVCFSGVGLKTNTVYNRKILLICSACKAEAEADLPKPEENEVVHYCRRLDESN